MNSVSQLNQIAQQTSEAYPVYEFSFDKQFYTCVCNFKGNQVSGKPSLNKKNAKQSAATAMLETVSNVLIVAFDPNPLWNGAETVNVLLKKNGEEKKFVLRI